MHLAKVMFESEPRTSSAKSSELAGFISLIANGDQNALAQFYDATNRLAFSLIVHILINRDVAEEILLDVYTQVWKQAANYAPERGNPLAWLMTIARSRALDKLRATKQEMQRTESLEVAADAKSYDDDPETAAAGNERQRLVRQALAQLTSEQRLVIELAYFGGMSHSEIALHLGQPLGTVKTRVRLGMMKLKESLSPTLGGN